MAIMDYLKPLFGVGGGIAGGLMGGPIGATLGAGAGSLLGGLGGNMFGRSSMPQQMGYSGQGYPGQNYPIGYGAQELPGGTTAVQTPRFTPQQRGGYEQLLQQGLSGMQNIPSAQFGPIADLYKTQFQQQTIPTIAERFTGMGAGGQRSSAFEQALGGAGAGLNQQLAGMEQQFNMQQRGQEISRLMNMLQMGLQPQFQTDYIPPEPGFLSSVGSGLGAGIGSAMPMIAQLLMQRYLGGGQ